MVIVALVREAPLTRILHTTGQEVEDQLIDSTLATAYDANVVLFQDTFGALTHISGQHDLHPLLGQDGRDSGLASATFGRGEAIGGGHLRTQGRIDRVVGTMAEMVVHNTVTGRDSNLCRFKGEHKH